MIREWIVCVCLSLAVCQSLARAQSVDADKTQPTPAQETSSQPTTGVDLATATPASQGVAVAGLSQFIQAADAEVNSLHSFLLVRHGQVVSEAYWSPWTDDKAHVLWSLTKSFTSTAIGIAMEEGKLSLDDTVVSFFPNEVPANPSENLRNMKVRDLLTMSCGHQDEVPLRGQEDWVKRFLAHPVPHTPGTHFQYNTPGSYMLSAILQKATGEPMQDYLQTRLFDPLHIPPPKWDRCPQGITIGGYGLYLPPKAIAKFGQLYLQNGRWNDRQIIPESYTKQATAKQIENEKNPESDWNQGYGFQFWWCRHKAYRGDGRDGQFCIVMPEQDAVIVITANTADMGKILALVWQHVLPSLQDQAIDEASQAEDLQHYQALIGDLKSTR